MFSWSLTTERRLRKANAPEPPDDFGMIMRRR
jgi:hypothetical protein